MPWKYYSLLIVDAQNHALVRFQQQKGSATWNGSVYGSLQFWHDLQRAYANFLSLGKPGQQMYHLVIDQEGPIVTIGPFTFPLF